MTHGGRNRRGVTGAGEAYSWEHKKQEGERALGMGAAGYTPASVK